ncbi:energy transducer TonB [Lysobacter solisilvae]|uniref:Energy transducer TonB n=1 Tax=Agrilutibacter solisilvae TaxID=2763317 RepID=A0A975AT12_9GAMM|nr:energy transducer TonB [Lysobacter solisilvae]
MALYQWMIAGILALGLSTGAHAAARPRAEGSMLVQGTIEVDTQGAVTRFSLDHRDALPADVVKMLDGTIPLWRFEPVRVDGQPVAARSDMNVRVVLKPLEKGKYSLGVNGATFGDRSAPKETRPVSKKLTPPDYPIGAGMQRGEGTVYVVVKVGRDGNVEDAIDEQVNLTGYNKSYRESVRAELAKAARMGARRWHFDPPTAGEKVDAPYWTVRVPVVFSLGLPGPPKPGQWEVYEPGPRKQVPWDDSNKDIAFSPDALPPGAAHTIGDGLRMLGAAP